VSVISIVHTYYAAFTDWFPTALGPDLTIESGGTFFYNTSRVSPVSDITERFEDAEANLKVLILRPLPAVRNLPATMLCQVVSPPISGAAPAMLGSMPWVFFLALSCMFVFM
jgi:hypothetical protein